MSILFKKRSSPQVQQNISEEARQEQLLKEAKQVISSQAFQMKRALDSNSITDALKYSSNLINELRTGHLWPKTYYALYIFAMDELRHLENYISEGTHNRSMLELYQMIQYAGNILPRLYLMITVGGVFIKKKEAPATDVLIDLVELCRGVQHPTRGLFLRTYLSEMMKDKLPDDGSKYEGEVKDSIDFILVNFTEMNKLWVRMQHGLHNLDKREQEREELNVLVGKNLSRLSQLDGLTVNLYKTYALPKILDQVKKCKDRIAQNYLMVIIIQAFPDEYHLQTLSQLLDTLGNLEQKVKVHSILNSLIVRLSGYCSSPNGSLPSDISMFDLFKSKIEELSKSHPSVTLDGILEMCHSLSLFCLRCYKAKLEYLDNIYEYVLETLKTKDLYSDNPEALNQLLSLLILPLEHFKDLKNIFQFKYYINIVNFLAHKDKRQVSLKFIKHMSLNDNIVQTEEEVTHLLNYFVPISKLSESDSTVRTPESQEEDGTYFSSGLSLMRCKDVDTMYRILLQIKDYLGSLETIKLPVTHTVVPLAGKALYLIQTIYKGKESDNQWEKKVKAVAKYVSTLITMTRSNGNNTNSIITFNLYLQSALETGKCGLSNYTYGFLTQGALTVYEEDNFLQSPHQLELIRQLIATLEATPCLEADKYETLAKRLAQHASLLSVVDNQARATLAASHLFNSKTLKDSKSCTACLNKAVSICKTIEDSQVSSEILVEILDVVVSIYNKDLNVVDAKFVNKTLQTVQSHLSEKEVFKGTAVTQLQIIKDFILYKQNWKNYLAQEAEAYQDFNAVSGSNLSKSEAKSEAEKWSSIVFNQA